MNRATEKPREYEILWENINKLGFYDAVKKVYNYNWKKEQNILKFWNFLKIIFPPITYIRRFLIKLIKGGK